MTRVLRIAGVAIVGLLLGTALGALIGLSAECTGSTRDCPHSDAWRYTLLATPIAAAALLLVGTAWSVRRRRLWPVVLASAAVLTIDALVDAALYEPGFGTAVVLASSLAIGRAAVRRA